MTAIHETIIRDTEIFVAADINSKRQLTIFKTTVVEDKVNGDTLILPVLNPGTVKFIDLDHDDFFVDLKEYISSNRPPKICRKASSLRKFKISIVSLDALKNMNIGKKIMRQLMEKHSSPKWGFILLSFKKKDEYCPVAYTHDIVGDNVFVPQCSCDYMYTVGTTREPKIPNHCQYLETTFLRGDYIKHIELPEVIVIRKYTDPAWNRPYGVSNAIFGIDHEGSEVKEYKPGYSTFDILQRTENIPKNRSSYLDF